MKVLTELAYLGNTTGYGRSHEARGASGYIQAMGLVFLDGNDAIHRRTLWQGRRNLGLLTVITGIGTIAKSIDIEISRDELAEFCRTFLREYESRT